MRSLESSCDPDQTGVADFVAYDETGEDWPVVDGYGALVAAWAAEVPVTLDAPAQRVVMTRDGVAVETPCGTIAGRAALVTVSTGVLASGRITFEPELPSWKTTAAEEVPLGVHNKIAILLNAASPALPEPQYLTAMTRDHDSPVVLNVRPYGYDYVMGTTAGRFGDALERAGRNASVEFLVEHMKAVFGNGIARCLTDRVIVTAWRGEPWTLGGYSAPRPGRSQGRLQKIPFMNDCSEIACSQKPAGVRHLRRLLSAPGVEHITCAVPGSGLDPGIVQGHPGVVPGGIGPARQHPRNSDDFRVVRSERLLAFGERGREQGIGGFIVVQEKPGNREVEAGQGHRTTQELAVPRTPDVAVGRDMALFHALVKERAASHGADRHASRPLQRTVPGIKRRRQRGDGAVVVLFDQEDERAVVPGGGPARIALRKVPRQGIRPPPQVDRLLAPRRAIRVERRRRKGVPLPFRGQIDHGRAFGQRQWFRRQLSIESSMASTRAVWWAGAMVPVITDLYALSRNVMTFFFAHDFAHRPGRRSGLIRIARVVSRFASSA